MAKIKKIRDWATENEDMLKTKLADYSELDGYTEHGVNLIKNNHPVLHLMDEPSGLGTLTGAILQTREYLQYLEKLHETSLLNIRMFNKYNKEIQENI